MHMGHAAAAYEHHTLMGSAAQPNSEELWKTALLKQVELQRNLQDQLDVRTTRLTFCAYGSLLCEGALRVCILRSDQ